MPRYLSFARAVALVSLGACGPSAAPATTTTTPVASTPVDRCSTCSCDPASVNPPYCLNAGIHHCCAVVPRVMPGPLPPPDLSA